jgi:hypothetical protein
MTILLVAFLIASLAATAVSASHSTSSKVASVTVVRGARASPGGSFYILPSFSISYASAYYYSVNNLFIFNWSQNILNTFLYPTNHTSEAVGIRHYFVKRDNS